MPLPHLISIHAAREGGDSYICCTKAASKFQSTPPVKAATEAQVINVLRTFISIHAAREGGDALIVAEETKIRISIHAAREGGDSP